MEKDIKIDTKFKQAFNLGYRLAKELDLKSHIFQNQEKTMSSNPMHLGMQQYIDEAKLSKGKQQENSTDKNQTDVSKKGRDKSRGEDLSL
ncbi:hypothetical protein [Muricauda sp. MAR_2010_75]|uniref:hypothetical protein n=1 Tax=Allomuricauda sp. MAR_2010_75 TaxID=1250232 RepID=UPI00056B6F72|nr:hypothetical protein [Muricauda sp. MAR_2010_75]